MSAPPSAKLNVVRGLGLVAAVSIVIGHIIGQGVFLKSRIMTCNVETPGLVMLAWVMTGLLTLAGALTITELATLMPRSGGSYVYLRETYGPHSGFLNGWKDLVIGPAGIAAGAVGFAIFLNVAAGGAFSGEIFSFNVLGTRLSVGSAQAASVTILSAIMFANCAAVSVGGWIATALTFFKISLVAAIGLAVLIFSEPNWSNFAMSGAGGTCEGVAASARGGGAGFAAAMLGAFSAYSGWQALSYMGGEVKDPSRNMPLAIIGGAVSVMVLYLFVNAAYFLILTPEEIASVPLSSSVATAVVEKFYGPLSSRIMAATILVSIVGFMQISSMKIARSVFAMSRDGLLLRPLGEVSPRTRVPSRVVVIQSVWAMTLVFFGSYDTLVDYQNFIESIFFGMMAAAVFVLRRKRPNAERPYRTLGYPVVPALFLLVMAWIFISTLISNPLRSLTGIGLLALGLPIYWYRHRQHGSAGRVRLHV